MICSKCNKSISDDSKFCTFCGISLRPISEESKDSEMSDLKNELDALKKDIKSISNAQSGKKDKISDESVKRRSIKPPNINIPSIPTSFIPDFKPTKNEIELIFGQNWLARIGSLAILFGLSFFVQAAISSNWLSNTVITIIGLLSGLIFASGGYFFKDKLDFYAKTLSGTGMGILFITIFSAYSAFELINIYIGIFSIFLVSILGHVLSLKLKSITIGIITLTGAYSVPIISSFYVDTFSLNSLSATGYYLPLVAISHAFFITNFKNIYNLISLNLAGWISFLIWIGGLQDNSINIEIQFALSTSIFIVMLITWIWTGSSNRQNSKLNTVSLLLSTIGYLLLTYVIFWNSNYQQYLGFGSFVISIMLISPFIYSWIKSKPLEQYVSYPVTSFLVLFIAIPVQFSSTWTTVLWSIQLIIMNLISSKFNIKSVRLFSYLLFALILIKGIIWDMYNTAEMEPVLNSRFWSLGFIFISGYTTYFYFKNVQMDNVEKGIISLTYYTSLIIILLNINAEIFFGVNYYEKVFSSSYKTPVIFILWILTSAIMCNAIIFVNKEKPEHNIKRYFGYSVFIIFSVLISISSLFLNTEKFIPFFNIRTALLISIITLALITKINTAKIKLISMPESHNIKLILETLIYIMPFVILSTETYLFIRYENININPNYFNALTSASWGIVWAITGTVYIYTAIKNNIKSLRYIGLLAISISIIKLFIFDLFLLPTTIRIIAFIICGLILLVAGLNYQKNVDLMKKILN